MQLASINNLTYRISNSLLVLDNITFDIEYGDFISIVGPNGSGKTTLFKLLLGIKKTTSGTINFASDFAKEYTGANKTSIGRNRNRNRNRSGSGSESRNKNKSRNKNRSRIAYVPQVKTLDKKFPATALELVVSGILGSWNFLISKKNKQLALNALELVGADSLAKRQVSELSGGELQRVYLARAVVREPQLLLLDEPATGIDFVCEQDISDIISNLNKTFNTTVLMISHDLSAAYTHSNKVLLLNKRIIYYGAASSAFCDENMLKTFSNAIHRHDVKFGIKDCNC